MPIPHFVTKDFFVPDNDTTLFGEEFFRATRDQVNNRVNDLIYLFNLLDSAFGRRESQNESTESQTEENSNDNYDEADELSEESDDKLPETADQQQQQRPDENADRPSSMFNLPNFNRVRDGILQYWLANDGNRSEQN